MDSQELDSLLSQSDLSVPVTPQTLHSNLIDSEITSKNKMQASRMVSEGNNMTPPPSTQVSSPQRTKTQRTPTPPLSHISTPPPTIDANQGSASRLVVPSTEVISLTDEQISSASSEELRTRVTELHAAASEARMSAAHYKLQYNMLLQESRAALDRMAVEARMAQFENDVIYSTEQAKAAASPAQQSPIKHREDGVIPVETGLYQRILKELNSLRDTNWAFKEELDQKQQIILQQEGEITTLTEKVAMLRDRIRSHRDNRANSVARVESTPKSLYNTPNRGRNLGQHNGHEHSGQPFAALLQASEMASQQQARSHNSKRGHSRNTHSMSSLPATPYSHRKQQSMMYSTPHHKQSHNVGMKIPSTAPVQRSTVLRTPDTYPPPPIYPLAQPHLGRDDQSDGTVSASEQDDNDSEAETDIVDPSNENPVAESRASMTASQMLRSSQEDQQSARKNFREDLGITSTGSPVSMPKINKGNKGVGATRQTKLFGAVRKSNLDRDGEQPPAKRAKTTNDAASPVGLGIGGIAGHR